MTNPKQYIYKPTITIITMKIKNLFQRFLSRPRYLVLDKRGVSNIISQIDFFKERGQSSLFSFLNNSRVKNNDRK